MIPKKYPFHLEILFFACLCLPFVLISFSLTPGAGLFYLFPLGFAILPFIGGFILYLELKLFKTQVKADPVILALCAVDIFSGVIGWLMFLLIAVTRTHA